VLRNPLDREVVKTPGTVLAHLFTGGKLQPQAPPTAPRRATADTPRPPVVVQMQPPKKEEHVMEIIQGTKKQEQKFAISGEGK
jgi:hypothetical protein